MSPSRHQCFLEPPPDSVGTAELASSAVSLLLIRSLPKGVGTGGRRGSCPSNLNMIQKLFPKFVILILPFLRFSKWSDRNPRRKMGLDGFWLTHFLRPCLYSPDIFLLVCRLCFSTGLECRSHYITKTRYECTLPPSSPLCRFIRLSSGRSQGWLLPLARQAWASTSIRPIRLETM